MLKIKIDCNKENSLSLKEIKYVFETLCLTAGTAWHFVGEDFKGEIDIYYGRNPGIKSMLWIKANSSTELITTSEPRLIKENDWYFLDFTTSQETDSQVSIIESGVCKIKNDIIYTIFYLITGKDEKNISRNKHDQHDVWKSVLFKNKLLHIPFFNQYVNLIEQLFATTHAFVPRWKDGKKAALALSHDVDYPEMIKSIEIARYIFVHRFKSKLATIADIVSGKNHFWKFDDYIQLEKSFGAKSAFYFCPLKGSLLRYFFVAPDPFYNVRKANFKKISRDLTANQFEVGLHSSYFAFKSEEKFQKEKDELEKEFGVEILGNRHHYWHMNPENPSETALIHQNSGLFYDSSISFERHSGFRYSICTPFNLWNEKASEALSILQLPPTLMDDHLFGHAEHTSFSNYEEHIDSLVNAVTENGGVFVADFHVRVLNSTFYPKWADAYKYLLETVTRKGEFYIDTPLNISKHWQQRITKIKESSKDEIRNPD